MNEKKASDASNHSSWAEFCDEVGDLQEHELRGESLFQITQKLTLKHSEEILNVIPLCKFISLMDEISTVS